MTFPSHFHMPGAFHADGTSTVHPGLFRPPGPSPTAADAPTAKRKRFRDDAPRPDVPPVNPIPDSCLDGDDASSTTPAAASRTYILAGQLDTPNGGPGENGVLGESMYSDSDYRRVLGSKRTRDDPDAAPAAGHTPLFNLPPQPAPVNRGWGSFAFTTIGGVVGKVWQFCRDGAFKGFHAGGGRGYAMDEDGSIGDVSMFDSRMDDYQNIPGQFPQAEREEQHCDYDAYATDDRNIDSRASTPSQPATKRRQMDQTDDLGRNWVVVNEPPTDERKPSRRPPNHRPSPRNRNHGPSVATGRRISTPTARLSTNPGSTPRRPSSRAAFRDSPALEQPRPASSASFASPRSPSPSKIPKATASPVTHKSSSQPTHSRRRSVATGQSSYPPPFTHRRTHSGASIASPRRGGPDGDADASPRLNAEAKQLAARRKMEERDADVRIAAFNKRLQDMIRQGKEALGTTVDVEIEGGGDAWEDE